MYGLLVYFSDARFSRLAAASALARRFIAARIKTSSSVKPRVVIFHMTSHSAFERRIFLKGKIRANVMPNVSAGKDDGYKKSIDSRMLKASKLSIVTRVR
jgi:hypothetical protein